MTGIRLDQLRRWARAELAASEEDADPREANLLPGLALGWDEARVLARGDTELTEQQASAIRELVQKRCQGTPFAYLSGEREFYGRSFHVDPRVLIPRPETEHLIDTVLGLSPAPEHLLDIGTGSGCIAITLALERTELRTYATDASVAALAVAGKNRAAHRVDPAQLALAAADLNTGIDISFFDTIVCNPPYVALDANLPNTVAGFEPHSALFADDSGLSFYRKLLGPDSALESGQRIVLELGADQRGAVEAIAQGRFATEAVAPDLAGWDRVIALRRL